MIPYPELVNALTEWRIRNGLPVADLGDGPRSGGSLAAVDMSAAFTDSVDEDMEEIESGEYLAADEYGEYEDSDVQPEHGYADEAYGQDMGEEYGGHAETADASFDEADTGEEAVIGEREHTDQEQALPDAEMAAAGTFDEDVDSAIDMLAEVVSDEHVDPNMAAGQDFTGLEGEATTVGSGVVDLGDVGEDIIVGEEDVPIDDDLERDPQ